MAETASYQAHNEIRCGFRGPIFHLRGLWLWKSHQKPLPTTKPPPNSDPKPIKDPIPSTPKTSTKNIPQRTQFTKRRHSDASRNSTSSSSNTSGQTQNKPGLPEFRRLKKEPSFTSGDLSLAISDNNHRRPDNSLFRASSGNIMLLGHLGNLKQKQQEQGNKINIANKSLFHPRAVVTGNTGGGSNKLDPEVMKSMGNEKYKEGRFEEALSLYNRAISVNPKRASYHSNKSAALIGLDRLIEAAFACAEAVRIEPCYRRAHYRLATLYLRLGEAEKALHHYKHSGLKADSEDIVKAQALKLHLIKLNKAREVKDWSLLLKESHSTISCGADSSPKIYALQVEAQLKLQRHKEAYDTFQKLPHFDVDSCSRLFGQGYVAYLLFIQAQVYMVAGRIEDAVAVGQKAGRLDPSAEVNAFLKRAHAVASARSKGNQLFKALKFSEAYTSYNEGLQQDPYNPVLLCNRAACRSKLGQFEKATEDCTAALNVRPSYGKARLRRADCYVKMEWWEAAVQDYEMLIREEPGDEEVGRALFEARVRLKKQQGEDTRNMKFRSNVVLVSSKEQFRHFVTVPGMCVVLFCDRTCHKHVLQLGEQVCQRFPSINFLKVEIEDHPYLAKYEGVSSVPAFKIYKNGLVIKEIPGNNSELLESSVKVHCS